MNIEQIRLRLGEMAAEVERLTAENARLQQSPSWKLGKMNDEGKIVEVSPEVAVPDQMVCPACGRGYGSVDSEVVRLNALLYAERCKSVQSPSITEHDDDIAVLVAQELYSNGGAHESQIDVARRIISFIASRLPQLVTEQDADSNDPIFSFVAQHYPLTAKHVESIYRECLRLIASRHPTN